MASFADDLEYKVRKSAAENLINILKEFHLNVFKKESYLFMKN